MDGHAACDQWCYAECSELAAVELVVVAAIGDDTLWTSLRWAWSSAHRRDRLYQQQKLGAVVAVGAGESPGQRQTAAAG